MFVVVDCNMEFANLHNASTMSPFTRGEPQANRATMTEERRRSRKHAGKKLASGKRETTRQQEGNHEAERGEPRGSKRETTRQKEGNHEAERGKPR